MRTEALNGRESKSMSQDDQKIPVRDEQPQQSNSDKTAAGMQGHTESGAEGRQTMENQMAEEPSGYRGENPGQSGMGGTAVHSGTPENASGQLNPSAPGDTGTTPGSTAE